MVDVSGSAAGGGTDGDTACPDAWVVLVADPVTGETDAFGPFDREAARADAARRRAEHAAEGLDEVLVVTVPLTPPED
ncbi:hypothetical protein [Actinomycetospora cinnamomea]|uniref:Uncharacterized protein n=1 Tax=Actinomycetospora cinnamomea TaxID=663609 RepID=A0A2U1FG99_9PSEU|nr:hypothetical protein [Actinomycetospora cinnamomea]PVZ11177.1 hypothetical protein C8D89_104392 [Actinomycetospora cinnamomea]